MISISMILCRVFISYVAQSRINFVLYRYPPRRLGSSLALQEPLDFDIVVGEIGGAIFEGLNPKSPLVSLDMQSTEAALADPDGNSGSEEPVGFKFCHRTKFIMNYAVTSLFCIDGKYPFHFMTV